jgi:site-specific DNA recombinase
MINQQANSTAKRVVAYIRVSDPSQLEGHSLAAQERLFFELCKNRGWQPVKVYREEGKSARFDAISKRPVFRQLLDDAARHQFDLVVVHTLDRWARNLKVMLESLSILARYGVGIASISENIDYSTPQGKLFTQMLGSFAEYFSGALSNHVSKGMDQRALEGRHVGGIPFGYESCWIEENGERKRRCKPEHRGSIHQVKKEAEAVIKLFNDYSTGTATTPQQATWLNENGFRTRNTHKLPDAYGNLVGGPKLFTAKSVQSILSNPFYAGDVRYKGQLLPAAHEPLISRELFERVQVMLKKNNGRCKTLEANPERSYLLKGIIRCAYCGMPMWSQTLKIGKSFYREHRNSRSLANCQASGTSISCKVPDRQIDEIIGAIELNPQWLEEVIAIVNLKDEETRIKKRRTEVQEKLKRIGKIYVDKLISDDEYNRQLRMLNGELESLVVPGMNAAEEAGRLISHLPELWAGANLEEKRNLLLTMLEAVYFDVKQTRSIVALKPKPRVVPVFQVAVTREGSGIHIIRNESSGKNTQNSSVFMVETGEAPSLPYLRLFDLNFLKYALFKVNNLASV